MQTHTGALTSHLDASGVDQLVITSRLSGPVVEHHVGERARTRRVGVRIRRWRQLWALTALPHVLTGRGQFDRGQFHLVHAHQGEDLAVLPLGWLAARWHRCPLVVTVHCSVSRTLRPARGGSVALRTLGPTLERSVLRRAAAVITLTARAASALSDDGVAPERIHVIPSGVDVSKYRRRHADPFPQVPRPRVVYIGRLAPQKGVETLVQAFGALSADAHLLVVGDGPLRGRLQRLTAALDLRDRVHFTGFVPRRVVPAVLRHTDVLVLPSRYEELGSVLLEGLAAGVPIVATATGGIPEVIADGRTGLIVPPSSPAALAAAIARLLADEQLANRLRRGAAEAADRYEWRFLAQDILDVYRSVTADASDSTPSPQRR